MPLAHTGLLKLWAVALGSLAACSTAGDDRGKSAHKKANTHSDIGFKCQHLRRLPGLASRHRQIDADFEPFAKLPRTSDINGFVVAFWRCSMRSPRAATTAGLEEKSADCRSFAFPPADRVVVSFHGGSSFPEFSDSDS